MASPDFRERSIEIQRGHNWRTGASAQTEQIKDVNVVNTPTVNISNKGSSPILQLLHQHQLASHRVEHLQQFCSAVLGRPVPEYIASKLRDNIDSAQRFGVFQQPVRRSSVRWGTYDRL